MEIRKGVDLGKCFDQLKGSMKRAEEAQASGQGYSTAYGILSVGVHWFLDTATTADDISTPLFNISTEERDNHINELP